MPGICTSGARKSLGEFKHFVKLCKSDVEFDSERGGEGWPKLRQKPQLQSRPRRPQCVGALL